MSESKAGKTGGVTYEEHGYWKQYQSCFPEKVRLEKNQAPQEHWWSWEGHQIHIDRMKPQKPRPTKVLLIHGGGGNGRLLVPLAKALWDAGYESLAPDLPGYGLSQLAPGTVPDYHLWLELLAALVAKEKSREPERPLVVFGLSVGGMTGYLTCAGNDGVDGVIATTLLDVSNRELRDGAARSRLLSQVGGGIMFGMPWLFDRVKLPVWLVAPLDAMSTNERLVELLKGDPHVGRVRMPSRFFRTLAEVKPPTDSKRIRERPLLLAHPGADVWTPTVWSEAFFDQIQSDNKELVILENCGHFPLEEPGLTTLMESVTGFLKRVDER